MTFDQRSHLGSEELEQYSFGRLSEAECERVEEHLLLCERCQDELTRVETFIRDVKAACQMAKKESKVERVSLLSRWLSAIPRPVMVTAFAAVVLAIVVPAVRQPVPELSAYPVQLSVMRGLESAGAAEAERGRPLQLRISSAELPASPAYRMEIVNVSGAQVWAGQPHAGKNTLVADVNTALPAGTYWVRLFAGSTEPLREFGLVIR